MIDIVTNNVRQIGTPADEGRVYISEKAYKRIKTEGFKDKEVFVLMGHTESSGGRYATFVEAAIAVYDMEFDKNAPLWTNKVWSRVFAEIKKSYEELIIVGWAFRQDDFPAEPTPMLENIHREHFGGAHQLMFLLNRTEQEENFFIKKNNHLKKKTGFFVYYRMNGHCDSAESYNKTDSYNKSHSRYEDIDTAAESRYSQIHKRASAGDRINVTFPVEFGSISKERGRYRKAMEAGKEPRKGSFASVVMVAAIAVLIVLIGLKAGAGMSGTLDKKETLPAMSTEEDLIPVEKISGEWYTDK
ncbi:hypothetical protein [Agathobacter sp.]|uniref:hypothetical protein n=1 Tax=Agathobacter sp. TaxID=2021311 RepID=UPI003FD7429B